MNVHLPMHMDKPAFLAWLQEREGRYELVEGRVVMMVGASRAHARLVRNLVLLLCARLDLRRWEVITEFGLDAGPQTLRYPDIVVDRAGGLDRDYTATAPALLVEVLSPSTETVDPHDKAAEYLRLPSLAAYIVLSQHEPRAWVWARQASQLTSGPETMVGDDKTISIPALGLELLLSDIYAGNRSS